MSTESRPGVQFRRKVDLRGIPFFVPVDRDLYEKQKELGRITASDELRLQRSIGLARHYEVIGTGLAALAFSFYGHFRARPRWGIGKTVLFSSLGAMVGLQAGSLAIRLTTWRTLSGCENSDNVVLALNEMVEEQRVRNSTITADQLGRVREAAGGPDSPESVARAVVEDARSSESPSLPAPEIDPFVASDDLDKPNEYESSWDRPQADRSPESKPNRWWR